jgi:hypothetical protein
MLLADFATVYFACDDFFMLTRRDLWCGIIARAAQGTDLFVLDEFGPENVFPLSYKRVRNWRNQASIDVEEALFHILKNDPDFPINKMRLQSSIPSNPIFYTAKPGLLSHHQKAFDALEFVYGKSRDKSTEASASTIDNESPTDSKKRITAPPRWHSIRPYIPSSSSDE